ncbi:Endonuclease [Mycena indigotica]|uniref:Endonuclease n=1 Tax=Mycena indigotica TaxID=2126181 RepID=A0A8H6VV89_9AGAR|nr:Endonuclease [Mycena indigotica]KAF7295142.1 Endonuclease [Mycena indigotica]
MAATHHHHNNLKILKADLNVLHPPAVEFGPTEDKVQISKDPHVKEVLKYGNPGPVFDALVRKAYVAAYDRRLRHPSWTAQHLTAASLQHNPGVNRSKSQFTEDEELPIPFRARLADYFKSGYDRGHMVPAADAKFSQVSSCSIPPAHNLIKYQDAMNETFLLSNIAPQVGDGFNRHYWAYLEDWCRRLTSKFSDVYVFTVPLYLPRQGADKKWRITHEVIGSPPNVSVPTHFAKVVLATKSSPDSAPELSAGAFVVPNAIIPDNAPMESFMMPIEAVEHAAGILLFSKAIKAAAKNICTTAECELIVRKFDDKKRQEK